MTYEEEHDQDQDQHQQVQVVHPEIKLIKHDGDPYPTWYISPSLRVDPKMFDQLLKERDIDFKFPLSQDQITELKVVVELVRQS